MSKDSNGAHRSRKRPLNGKLDVTIDLTGSKYKDCSSSSLVSTYSLPSISVRCPNSPESIGADDRPAAGVAQQAEAFRCFVCNENLELSDEFARASHINTCLDRGPVLCEAASSTRPSIAPEDDVEGLELVDCLKAESLSCIICDLDLSRRNLLSRCLHLKKCARAQSIGVRDLLRMLSPHDDITEPVDQYFEEEAASIELLAASISTKRDVNSFLMHNAKFSVASVSSSRNGLGNASAQNGVPPSDAPPRNVNSFLMAAAKDIALLGKKRPADEKAISATDRPKQGRFYQKKNWNGAKSGSDQDRVYQDDYAPEYKKIQYGSLTFPIVVDGFQYASKGLTDTYFLTHFHSDHYGGLTSRFDCGRIFCSPATASLVKLRLRVPATTLVPLALEVKHTILISGAKVDVTLIDANHCPGAVLLLFEFSCGKKVLHTGDFRYTREMLSRSPALRCLSSGVCSVQRNLVVYLDTTYCDPQYNFPDQRIAISAVVEAVKRELLQHERTLFVFGAYGIGKERVFMAVAEELNIKVHVDPPRWKAMMCYDWDMGLKSRLTSDGNATFLWVAAMSQINFKALEALRVKANSTRSKSTGKNPGGHCDGTDDGTEGTYYSRVVGFQPTGWSHTAETSNASSSIVTARRRGQNVIYSVPYSEHSSFTELVNFVDTFRPQRIIPTVNTQRDKVKAQLALLNAHSSAYRNESRRSVEVGSNGGFLSPFSSSRGYTNVINKNGSINSPSTPQGGTFNELS